VIQTLTALALLLALRSLAFAEASYPPPVEADFVARDVRFESGERASEIRMHYRTVGQPRKGADGVVRNAVLILHGTGGSGRGFVSEGYAGRLFGRGQLLDADRYFIRGFRPLAPSRRDHRAAAGDQLGG
jgi:homoserine O-acetyltransferase